MVADGSSTGLIGCVHNVPVSIGVVTVHLNFLPIDETPLDTIIGTNYSWELEVVLEIIEHFMDALFEDKTVRTGPELDSKDDATNGRSSPAKLLTMDDTGEMGDNSSDEYESDEVHLKVKD